MILCNCDCSIRINLDSFRHPFRLIMDKVASYGNPKVIKTCAILIFALMLSNTGNTLAGESMKLSENDSGKKVEIGVGEELEVILPGKPTTGYIWEVSSLDSNFLRPGKADFIANGKVIGAGGMEIIKFHAIAVGESKVKLIFHRSFEPDIPPLKTFEVTVIIKK